jgi:uracil-DNA glycosylase
LLTKIVGAMGFSRAEVDTAMVVKCHNEEGGGGPDLGEGWRSVKKSRHRAPSAEAIRQCLPFLHEQISAVQPVVVVTFGTRWSRRRRGCIPSRLR